MLSTKHRTALKNAFAKVRQDNEISIVIRRGNETLPTQLVRFERTGTGQPQRKEGDNSREVRGVGVVMGDPDLDIQVDDRFTEDGILYRVFYVRPNRMLTCQASAEAVQ